MSTQFPLKEKSTQYGYGLLALLILFCFRVGAQALQRWAPVNFLPPFEDWQSGALPYELLLAFQIGIIDRGQCLPRNSIGPGRRFGTHLLEHDFTEPSIMFGKKGLLSATPHAKTPGLTSVPLDPNG